MILVKQFKVLYSPEFLNDPEYKYISEVLNITCVINMTSMPSQFIRHIRIKMYITIALLTLLHESKQGYKHKARTELQLLK
jgi:hypothetical protein